MASETNPKETQDMAATEMEGVIRQGEVILKGRLHQLTLLENGIRLVCCQDKAGASISKSIFSLSTTAKNKKAFIKTDTLIGLTQRLCEL
ncbi:hypothetical protein BaRGS_00012858 [Batillaria attramentaria]|uniref:Uncharacterized protein n=1 Tax=Batillaria attramentaria TaxID=370345 RepID=A0ABD0L9K2_9CAEN